MYVANIAYFIKIGNKSVNYEYFLQILSQMEIGVRKEIEMIMMLVPVPAEPVQFYLTKRRI